MLARVHNNGDKGGGREIEKWMEERKKGRERERESFTPSACISIEVHSTYSNTHNCIPRDVHTNKTKKNEVWENEEQYL